MVASRNQMHTLARGFGNTPNGSLPPFGAMGEINARMNPSSFIKHREVTALGEANGGSSVFGLPFQLALGGAMIYFGLDMPGADKAIDFTKDVINQPYKSTQYAMLAAGIGAVVLYSYRNPQDKLLTVYQPVSPTISE